MVEVIFLVSGKWQLQSATLPKWIKTFRAFCLFKSSGCVLSFTRASLVCPWVLDGILLLLLSFSSKKKGSSLYCCTVTLSVVLFPRRCNPGAPCLHYSVVVTMKMMLTVEQLHLLTSQNQEIAIFHVSLTGTSALGRCTWPRISNTVERWSWNQQWDAKEDTWDNCGIVCDSVVCVHCSCSLTLSSEFRRWWHDPPWLLH